MNLDFELVREAQAVLETTRTTDTVHEAMREVIAQDRRRRLAQRDFKDLSPESIDKIRRPAGRS